VTRDDNILPRLTCNLLDDTPLSDIDIVKGTWEGVSAKITVNGKPTKVYNDGTWEGPIVINEKEAEKLGVAEDNPGYLIIRNLKVTPAIRIEDSIELPIQK
jgi:hypothetical protein